MLVTTSFTPATTSFTLATTSLEASFPTFILPSSTQRTLFSLNKTVTATHFLGSNGCFIV